MSNQPSLQVQIKTLEELEAYFQKPDLDLEEALKKHQEALQIAKQILSYLEKAETQIQQLEIKDLMGSGEQQSPP